MSGPHSDRDRTELAFPSPLDYPQFSGLPWRELTVTDRGLDPSGHRATPSTNTTRGIEDALRILLCAVTIALALGGCERTGSFRPSPPHRAPGDRAELARTWESAQVIVYDRGEIIRGAFAESATAARLAGLAKGPKRPAVIYLHGCDGLRRRAQLDFWEGLARQGYAIFMPDSFSREYRVQKCGRQGTWTYAARLAEIDYALERIGELGWVDSGSLVLYGHSEGGVAVTRYRGGAFRGAVISSSGCWKYRLQIPSLAVASEQDQRLLGRVCSRADERLVVPGDRHEVLASPVARARIIEFIERVIDRAG